MPSAFSVALLGLIRFYRRHLSHRKGYRCAWGQATGRDTCSGVGLRVVRRAGAWRGLLLMRRQFDRCTLAASATAATPAAGPYRRLRPLPAQRGDCDCGVPDFDCSVGSGRCRPLGWLSWLLEFADCCSCDWPGSNREQRAQRARERAQERARKREAARKARHPGA